MRETHTNADMSHENRLVYKIEVFFNSLKNNGVGPTMRKIKQRIYYKIKGVDFSTQNIYDLTRTGDHQEHGTALVSTSIDFLKQLLDDLERVIQKPIDKSLFVDFGSGKGAAIIHARELGFQKSIGVEFAKELHERALENINVLGYDNVESHYEDATNYKLPNDISLIYFFNPFDAFVMKKVVSNIMEQKSRFENDVYIIYGNASCTILRDACELLDECVYPSGAKAEFYKL
ncbi:MAG TPA: methyltransferase domain-containing protein [Campylobacterales bacterium]|nr:methyltransferase domain-containing protein [Campylobacterales bacterium]HHS93351.1 methyltransferase domain-containing protein [Campylobacterales bacterium]